MRLIDVDAFMEEHKHHWDCLSANDMYWKEQLVNRTPTIDAVEVVRCKDCTEYDLCGFKGKDNGNGFCSCGVKK